MRGLFGVEGVSDEPLAEPLLGSWEARNASSKLLVSIAEVLGVGGGEGLAGQGPCRPRGRAGVVLPLRTPSNSSMLGGTYLVTSPAAYTTRQHGEKEDTAITNHCRSPYSKPAIVETEVLATAWQA